MIKPDDIMLSSAEFIALVEKYEADAVKDYKKASPETRECYIIIEVPLHKSLCKKGFIDDLKVKYIEMVGEKLLHNTIKMIQPL